MIYKKDILDSILEIRCFYLLYAGYIHNSWALGGRLWIYSTWLLLI